MGKRKITSASKWREPREKGYLVTLPSGNVARIRPVALDVMIQSGAISDLLSPIAAKMLWTEIDTDEFSKAEDFSEIAEMAEGMAALFSVVCKAAFLSPKIGDDAENLGDGEIAMDDVSFNDKSHVFQLAIQPALVLRKFCEQQDRDVESVRTDEGNVSEAE